MSQDDLIDHMRTVYIDIFVKMVETNQFSVGDWHEEMVSHMPIVAGWMNGSEIVLL